MKGVTVSTQIAFNTGCPALTDIMSGNCGLATTNGRLRQYIYNTIMLGLLRFYHRRGCYQNMRRMVCCYPPEKDRIRDVRILEQHPLNCSWQDYLSHVVMLHHHHLLIESMTKTGPLGNMYLVSYQGTEPLSVSKSYIFYSNAKGAIPIRF